jgi:hypothetical protein
METTGEGSVIAYNPARNDYLMPILNNGAGSAWGSFGVEITFNITTDSITSIINPHAPAGNTRDVLWEDIGKNRWNPDGSIDMHYKMIQPNTIVDPPHVRLEFFEHLARQGPR